MGFGPMAPDVPVVAWQMQLRGQHVVWGTKEMLQYRHDMLKKLPKDMQI